MPQERDEARRREAEDALKRVSRDSESIGTSSFARAAGQAKGHFSGADAPQQDRIEVWGRRVGRGLALVFVLWLLWHLVSTYLLQHA
ncbi:hypothetical protein [Afifella sp. IM 167]|uniref:hypothetical protein n=1 Tax=Afifella sp. IM 167 TaxID=2033586 RepID=UPI001CCB261A|nr:hypothetical protein [Afifella sp. IM 167]MBZ8132819.1 hypothetical protein [Afifella sp. IM 167]